MQKKLLIVFFLAFVIRLISLNQSLWLDEATTARVVREYKFTQIISEFSPRDFHPPFYYLFMKEWTNVFGYSEIALRFPSVIFSLLTGWFVYLLGKSIRNNDSGQVSRQAQDTEQSRSVRMTEKRIGFWAAVFFLFNPLIVYYSQEARMYMMATFLLTGSVYYFILLSHAELVLRYTQDPELVEWISASNSKTRSRNLSADRQDKFGMTKALVLFNIFAFLSFITFYGSIFLIIPMLIYFLFKKQYSYIIYSALFIILSLFILSPLLYQQFANAKQQLSLVVNWGQILGKANLKNILLIPLKFSIGRISFYPKWLYWLVSGIWTSLVWIFVFKGAFKQKFLSFLVLGPLGFGILFSFFSPLLQYFRFLYLLPIISILLALGLATFHRLDKVWLIASGFIIFSFVYLLNSNFHREDWKNLSINLIKDKPIYMIYSSSDAIRYYRRDIKIIDLKSVVKQKMFEPTVNIVPYTSDIHGLDYQKIFKEKGYKKIQAQFYRDLTLEKWKK